jgi:hypothetical protein
VDVYHFQRLNRQGKAKTKAKAETKMRGKRKRLKGPIQPRDDVLHLNGQTKTSSDPATTLVRVRGLGKIRVKVKVRVRIEVNNPVPKEAVDFRMLPV